MTKEQLKRGEEIQGEIDKCHCGGKIDWKVVRGSLGRALHKGLCDKCNGVYTHDRVPDHEKGKKIAHEIGVVKWNDKRLTSQSADTQIGYFREIQHCKTCRNQIGEKCACVDCECIYCQKQARKR